MKQQIFCDKMYDGLGYAMIYITVWAKTGTVMGRISTEAGYEIGRREWSPGAPSYVFRWT